MWGHLQLCGVFLLLLSAASFSNADSQKTVEVVGFGECADCHQNNIKNSHAFKDLKVTIDCKLANGKLKRRGVGKLDEEGKFLVKFPQELVENGKLKEECYAQLHSASNTPCPTFNGIEATKLAFVSESNGKHTFSPNKKLKFSPLTCTSAFLWPFFKYPHTPSLTMPWPKKSFPKITFPPWPHKFFFPKKPFPCPPFFKKPFPHVPIFKKPYPPSVPVYPKPIPPPVPIYKKPLPPPTPVYVPKPMPPKKPCPPKVEKPPTPVYKPKPIPPPLPPKKPCPPKVEIPPTPVYKPKPIPPLPPKKPCPPISIPKLPPISIPKKPCPPISIPKLPPISIPKKPCPPISIPKLPPISIPKKPCPPVSIPKLPPHPKFPPKIFTHPKFKKWPSLPLIPSHP